MKDTLKRLFRFLVTIDSEEQVQTVPIEEHNKLKQALEEANNKIISLQKANEDIINKNEIIIAETEYSECQIRTEQVTSILSRLNLTDKERSKLLQILVKSDLSIDFIQETYSPISKKNISIVETKLPQKSVIEKRNDSNFIR
jgi:hypothetical protein